MKCLYLAPVCTFLYTASSTQQFDLTTAKNDFTPVETFFRIADSIRAGSDPATATWSGYFSIPVVSLFTHAPGFDSTVFVNDMKTIFSAAGKSDPATLTEQQRLMLAYRNIPTFPNTCA